MALYRHQDIVYLIYKQLPFLWDSEWEMFRPITSLTWDGTRFLMNDFVYCKDPTSPLYGFGNEAMKDACNLLTRSYGPKISQASVVRAPTVGPSEWWFDRMISLTPCAPRDRTSWKRMHRGRYFTCRRGPRNKLTRRNRVSKHNED
jgi:hypothetical protein